MKKKAALFFLLALCIFLLDQITKQLIIHHIGPFDTLRVAPFFNIIYAENTGSAFGMFKSLGNSFFIAVALGALIAVSVLLVRDGENRLLYSLVLGGAAGNLADRIRYGYVVDFLDLHIGSHHWPTFNVADSALTLGILLLLYKTFRDYKKGT
ncbi:MAG: signal peptidase II [Alphaproteobacteria bacterium]|uniref:Lipoprotein signal peptidase n=1 Tax=Candidatus Nitrobium versatile TaxID=2884831 RepID=A0A953JEC2_9BACT|nr:signal peptidase II [Candidatus Nitrobium versatile]